LYISILVRSIFKNELASSPILLATSSSELEPFCHGLDARMLLTAMSLENPGTRLMKSTTKLDGGGAPGT
jgi:hypothetical protein